MLASILGHRAIEGGYRVNYTAAADLIARTAKAALEGRWATAMCFWNGPQLLIVDELGYLPPADEAASQFVQVVSRRHEHGSRHRAVDHRRQLRMRADRRHPRPAPRTHR